LLCVLLGGLTLVPMVVDAAADTILPPKSRRVWFRRRVERHPGAEALSTIAKTLWWLGGFGTSAALLVLHAPIVVSRTSDDDGVDAALATTMMAPGAGPEPVDALGATIHPDAADAPLPLDRPEPPARYQIRAELGRGGMGVVYDAEDTVLGRRVALKLLKRGRLAVDADERFRREARALAQLEHPGIVQIFDLAEEPTGMWMAMERVSGGSLDALIAKEGKLDLSRAATMGAALADTLAYAHRQNVIHRDFKPANVLVTESGGLKITDFGLAKLAAEGPKLTQLGAVLGSPGYMSPEQASGDGAIDHRTDVYAFGVTLFEMVTGRCPFEGDTASVLAAHITKVPPAPSDMGVTVPEQLEALLAKLLSKDPSERPSDLANVADELRQLGTTPRLSE
jgi:serine/threonine protein kinase